MDSYQVYLNIDLLEVVPRSGRQRQEIMKFIYSLRDRPRTKGDYTDKDASLQTRQIKIIGDYAITYWLDDAVKSALRIRRTRTAPQTSVLSAPSVVGSFSGN